MVKIIWFFCSFFILKSFIYFESLLTNTFCYPIFFQRISCLSSLNKLQQLWLGRNKISSLVEVDSKDDVESDGDEKSLPKSSPMGRTVFSGVCQSLHILSLQSNRLTSMDGLEELIALEELYLSHNGISEIQVRAQCQTTFIPILEPLCRRFDIENHLYVLDVFSWMLVIFSPRLLAIDIVIQIEGAWYFQ